MTDGIFEDLFYKKFQKACKSDEVWLLLCAIIIINQDQKNTICIKFERISNLPMNWQEMNKKRDIIESTS